MSAVSPKTRFPRSHSLLSQPLPPSQLIPYCTVFTAVQLTVQMLTALVYNGRSGEIILNCLQKKNTEIYVLLNL